MFQLPSFLLWLSLFILSLRVSWPLTFDGKVVVLEKPCANDTQCDEIREKCYAKLGMCQCGIGFHAKLDFNRCDECEHVTECQDKYGDHHLCSNGLCECQSGYFRAATGVCQHLPKQSNNLPLVIGLPVLLVCVILAIAVGWWWRKKRNRKKRERHRRAPLPLPTPPDPSQVNLSPRASTASYLVPNPPPEDRNELPPSYDDTMNQEQYYSGIYESLDQGEARPAPHASSQGHYYENFHDGNPYYGHSRTETMARVTSEGHPGKLEQLAAQL